MLSWGELKEMSLKLNVTLDSVWQLMKRWPAALQENLIDCGLSLRKLWGIG